jgi:hypothetical protein
MAVTMEATRRKGWNSRRVVLRVGAGLLPLLLWAASPAVSVSL